MCGSEGANLANNFGCSKCMKNTVSCGLAQADVYEGETKATAPEAPASDEKPDKPNYRKYPHLAKMAN